MSEHQMFEDLAGRVATMGLGETAAAQDSAAPAGARPTDNVEMEDVSGWHPANAPTLPAHPRYKGETMQERRKFMLEYESYMHALSAFETAHGSPFVMPVSACIETETMRFICDYEFEKPVEQVTEQDWVNYFLVARQPDTPDDETKVEYLETDPRLADPCPIWDQAFQLPHVPSTRKELAVQIVDASNKDDVGGEVVVPLRSLLDQRTHDQWFVLPPTLRQQLTEKAPRLDDARIRLVLKFTHTRVSVACCP